MAESGPERASEGYFPGAALLFELADQPMAIVSPEGNWLRANPAFARMSGWREDELQGQAISGLVHPQDRDAVDRILRGKQPGEVELHLLTADGTFQAGRWRFTSAAASHVLLAVRESCSRAEGRLRDGSRFLAEDIEHRIRNHLAVIRSIIRRTAENTIDSEAFAHLQARIDSYARVQSKVRFAGGEGSIDLALLIEDELLAQSMLEGDHLAIEGPDIALSVRAAEVLALAVHELAMNAVKFGAFGVKGARVDVRWDIQQVQAAPMLQFRWTERGVPLDGAPARGDGFGMETLLQSLPYDLGAETRVQWNRDGIEFRMMVAVERIAAAPAAR